MKNARVSNRLSHVRRPDGTLEKVGVIAEELGVSRTTASRHANELRREGIGLDSEAIAEYRCQQMLTLADLEAAAANPKIAPSKQIELRLKVLELAMELTGTKAATLAVTKNLNLNVSPEDDREMVITVIDMHDGHTAKKTIDAEPPAGEEEPE